MVYCFLARFSSFDFLRVSGLLERGSTRRFIGENGCGVNFCRGKVGEEFHLRFALGFVNTWMGKFGLHITHRLALKLYNFSTGGESPC